MRYIILLLFFSFLLISCGDKQPEPIKTSQWKVFNYLPAETDFLLYTNLDELRKTNHWKSFADQFNYNKNDDWLSQFEKETGAGLEKGIDEVFTSSSWNGNSVIAVIFNNDADGIRKYFEDKSHFSSEKIGEKTVYALKNNSAAKFYFPEDDILLIIKEKDYLTKLINGNAESLKENKKFIEIIGSIRNKNHYWFATDKGSYAAALVKMLTGAGQNAEIKKILSSIDNISLSAEFSDGVKIVSIAGCKSPEDALLLSTTIRSAIAMNLLSSANPVMEKIIQSMDIDRTDKQISLEVTLNNDDILKLKDIARKKIIDKKL